MSKRAAASRPKSYAEFDEDDDEIGEDSDAQSSSVSEFEFDKEELPKKRPSAGGAPTASKKIAKKSSSVKKAFDTSMIIPDVSTVLKLVRKLPRRTTTNTDILKRMDNVLEVEGPLLFCARILFPFTHGFSL